MESEIADHFAQPATLQFKAITSERFYCSVVTGCDPGIGSDYDHAFLRGVYHSLQEFSRRER